MAILDVLKFDSTPDIFAWKYPNNELATWTQLIVNESQEAILFKNGVACDIFGPGRYVLSTDNIPILSEFVKIPFGKKSPFTAEVWFINKVHTLDIKWGTVSPIQIQDPKYNIFMPVRAFGQFGVQIVDSKKFLIKLNGTMTFFNKNTLSTFFKGLFMTNVKDAVSSYLIKNKISIVEINAYLDEISQYIKTKTASVLDEYGINIVSFYVNDIGSPEDDASVKKLKDALAKRAEMDIIGYNYQQERSFDTLEGAAKNEGSTQSGIMGAGIGLGMGVGMAQDFGSGFSNISKNISSNPTVKCPKCNVEVNENSKFCSNCSFDLTKSVDTSNSIKCSNCGSSMTETTKFCPECGNPYNPCYFCKADMSADAIVCNVCNREKPKPCKGCGTIIDDSSKKFCPECGISLVKKCGSCDSVIEGNPKFCPECGKSI